jgi:hypothetical protein
MAKKKKNNSDITVILPIHELNGKNEIKLFNNALDSIKNQEVSIDELIIVVPKDSEVENTMKEFNFGTLKSITRVVSNPNGSDFQTQINYGVSEAKTKWVSFLEFDDEFSSKWFKNVVQYREAHEDVDVFMPIIVDINANDGGFMGLTNEAVWANSFSDELGILDNNALLDFQNFNIDGFVIKKSTFDQWGGLKKNIKLTFIYEYLLRITANGARVMVIPRFGYKHTNQREGSLFGNYTKEMDRVEANWWLQQAKKEYFHSKERVITYDANVN